MGHKIPKLKKYESSDDDSDNNNDQTNKDYNKNKNKNGNMNTMTIGMDNKDEKLFDMVLEGNSDDDYNQNTDENEDEIDSDGQFYLF